MGEGTPHDADPPDGEIEIFATGSTILRAAAPAADTDSAGDPPSIWIDQPTADDESHRGYHARPGHRPGVQRTGGAATTSLRRGESADIVRPMFVPPERAVSVVDDIRVIDEIRHLHHRTDDGAGSRWLTWPVDLVVWPRRPIAATLHVRASPSMVVTVLELVPTRRLRLGRRRFVRRGVAAIESLAAEIERQTRTT